MVDAQSFSVAQVLSSAIVGGVSGVAFASSKINREEKARAQVVAKRNVEEIVGERLSRARRYQAGIGPGRRNGAEWVTDYSWASRVFIASKPLGRIRRYLIERRMARLVGRFGSNLALQAPLENSEGTAGAITAGSVQAKKVGKYDGKLLGSLDAALSKPRESKEVEVLCRELYRLSKCR